MTLRRWQRLSSRDVVRDRWVRLRADRCEIAPGKILDPFYVLEEPDWVHAFALNRAGEVLLVRQYRYPGDVFTWELPGGVVDPGEDPLAAAQRELLEETGATATGWRHVASARPNPARMTNRIHLYLAEEAALTQPARLDASEAIDNAFFPLATVRDLIRQGTFAQSSHIGLFYLALEHLGRIAHQAPTSG